MCSSCKGEAETEGKKRRYIEYLPVEEHETLMPTKWSVSLLKETSAFLSVYEKYEQILK